MAWTAPRTWVTSETVTSALMNTHVRDNLLETAPALASSGAMFYGDGSNSLAALSPIGSVGSFLVTDGTVPKWRQVNQASTTGSGTTTSTSYTAVPNNVSVSIATGTWALVFWSARVANNTAGQTCSVSMAVSNATTIAASNNWRAVFESNAANDMCTVSQFYLFGSLTAGTNDFDMQWQVSGGTGTIHQSNMLVFPIS